MRLSESYLSVNVEERRVSVGKVLRRDDVGADLAVEELQLGLVHLILACKKEKKKTIASTLPFKEKTSAMTLIHCTLAVNARDAPPPPQMHDRSPPILGQPRQTSYMFADPQTLFSSSQRNGDRCELRSMRDDCTEKCFTASLLFFAGSGKADDVYTEKKPQRPPIQLDWESGTPNGKTGLAADTPAPLVPQVRNACPPAVMC